MSLESTRNALVLFLAPLCLTVDPPSQTLHFDLMSGYTAPGAAGVHYRLEMADFNGDGLLDVIQETTGGQNNLFFGDGDGNFTDVTATNLPVDGDNTRWFGIADVDFDLDLDIILGNNGTQNRIYINDGSGVFTNETATRLPIDADSTYGTIVFDVDGDVDIDCVVCNNDGTRKVYLNNGLGVFTDAGPTYISSGTSGTRGAECADVDGDGDLDVVIANSTGLTDLYTNDGAGKFTNVTATQMPALAVAGRDVSLGDVDNDGDIDIYVGVYIAQDLLFLNDGNGNFTDVTAANLPASNVGVYETEMADVDLDGDLDVVTGQWEPAANHAVQLYINDGAGSFSTSNSLPSAGMNALGMAVEDIDQDGDADIVIGAYQPTAEAIYINRHTHIHATTGPVINSTWSIDVYGQPGYASSVQIVTLYVGVTEFTPRINLPPFGLLAIDPIDPPLPGVSIPTPGGMTTLSIPIPNLPALIGLDALFQGLHIMPPTDAVLTNLLRATVQ